MKRLYCFIIQCIPVYKDNIPMGFKYSAGIEKSTFNHNFFGIFPFQLRIYLSWRKVSKLQTIISNCYIKVILTFLLRTKNNSVEG